MTVKFGAFAKMFGNRQLKNGEAAKLDTDNNGSLSQDEVLTFITRNENLYAMLAVNLNRPPEECQEIATSVAYKLALNRRGYKKKRRMGRRGKKRNATAADPTAPDPEQAAREPTVKEFQMFLNWVFTPAGEQEFFHRTIFEAFDADGNGFIDSDELDNFLDVFYKADSIFAGDVRLPSKAVLKRNALESLDVNGDGQLDFYEIRALISGGAGAIQLLHKHRDEDDGDDDDDDEKEDYETSSEDECSAL